MRLLARIIGIVFALLLAVVIAAVIWVQDANRLKPELAALVAENTDYTVIFNGNLSWSLFPPLVLTAEDVALTENDSPLAVEINQLELKMDLSAMWEDVNQWQVTELTLSNTTVQNEESTSTIERFYLSDFKLNTPSPFELTAQHRSTTQTEPLRANLKGQVIYQAASQQKAQQLRFIDTRVTTDMLTGLCQATVSESDLAPKPLPAATEEDLLPLELLQAYNLSSSCAIDKLLLADETFTQVTSEVANVAGRLDVLLDIQDFFGGTMQVEVTVNTKAQPINWTVVPKLDNVDSQRLMDWSQQNLQWVAHIGMNSTITMRGNTAAELAQSVKASSDFDGGEGQINIAKIKQQLMQIAILAREGDEVSDWPDVWDYKRFSGRWQVNGAKHDLKFAIDNMSVAAQGTYQYNQDVMDLLANITMHPAPENSPFKINPLLEGTPIPIRCKGSSEDPKCRLDEGAAQQIIARALQSNDDSGLRRKLEQKIDEKVPEEYRDTARGILDLLGRALEED